jgi:hemerythrin-like domain-containing protein
MAVGTSLLDEAGNASMATAVMMSHHGLRRDIARFALALEAMAPDGHVQLEALQAQWSDYRNKLHGHHEAEDTALFPNLRNQAPALGPVIERLTADHRHIDPLLAEGDRAFAELPAARAAFQVQYEKAWGKLRRGAARTSLPDA